MLPLFRAFGKFCSTNRLFTYLFEEIATSREIPLSFRNVNEYDSAICRTSCFSNTYFQNVLVEWNVLTEDVLELNMLGEFKCKLLVKIRPDRKFVHEVHDIRGI